MTDPTIAAIIALGDRMTRLETLFEQRALSADENFRRLEAKVDALAQSNGHSTLAAKGACAAAGAGVGGVIVAILKAAGML